MAELLNNKYKLEDQTPEVQANLTKLLVAANKVRLAWNKPMTVTSGLRTMEDHIRIYKDIAQKKGIPFDESKVPKQSKHLYGKAVDIADPQLELTAWLKGPGAKLAEEAGLYFELGNSNWVHMQIEPPASGKRWFLP